jgi:type IV pilus assembly protein PilB
MAARPKILGQLLVDNEGVDPLDLQRVLAAERQPSERIGDALVRLGAASPASVARALSVQLSLRIAEVPLRASTAALAAVQPDLLRTHGLVPLAIDHRTIQIAMSDPLNLRAIDDVQFQTGRRVEALVATPEDIAAGLRTLFSGESSSNGRIPAGSRTGEEAAPPAASGGRGLGEGDMSMHPDATASPSLGDLVLALPAELRGQTRVSATATDLETETRRAPVVRLVDRLLRQSIDDGASDIHIEETGEDVRVRARIDGRLRQTIDLPAASRRAVLSRIKVIAGMDIAVRRRAQDGRVHFEHGGRHLTLRVSTLPVNGGEKAVVRILDAESAPRSLGDLGLSSPDLLQLRSLLKKGEGVLLSAGPTGSGKSTTLFAALSEMDRDTRNVVTLEDPVEYRLPGASQIQVDRRAGLGFPEALRAVLRQDPDVVMIGEIRDRETAEIAMSAAVTGHLVLSTIHTTDAPGAITRLLHMGVPPFLVAGGLAGVLAQRLVRRSCRICRGRGCEKCGDGLRGRTGVYQVLTVSDAMRDEISGGGSSARLRRLAAEAGTKSLESDARRAVAAGLTTPHEVSSLLHASATAGLPCPECGARVPFGAKGCPQCGRRRGRTCSCGQPLERGWRYCPSCIRPART